MTNQKELVEHLINNGALKTLAIIEAFRAIDRADFMLPDYIEEAYGDYPLPIGYEQTISQPSTVAFMLELLEANEGDRILDVGSGSCWTTALLAQIVGPRGRVWGMEIIPELVELGGKNIAKYNFPNVEILQAGEKIGLEEEAPFDKILVSAAGERLHQELVDQLQVGGNMVMPVENSIFKIYKASQAEIKKKEFPGFVFVPLK